MACSDCGFENPEGMKFCGECGGALRPPGTCAGCGFENPAGFKFCGECGAGIDRAAGAPLSRAPSDYTPKHLAVRILQSKAAIEGERKRVTVLFADVKGSMELAEELDPEVWHAILDRFFAILSEGVHRFEGTVNQYTCDGIMALFGAPIAHEDHAHRACYAALHLRDAVREYANEVRQQHGLAFGVRIGINSGEVVVGKIGDDLRMDYTARGHVVGLAQRMESLAESGHICLSEHTRSLVEGYFELEDLGRTQVKGASEPVGLFDLVGVGPFRTRLDRSRARGLSTFIGRENEMAVLDAALGHARLGQGRIVGVVADAGVGKSRLCFEFIERCRANGVVVQEAHCPAHGRTVSHLPILELMRGYFGLGDGDSPRIAREKIAGRLLLLDREFEDALPLIWDFMRVPDPERAYAEDDMEIRQRSLQDFVRRLVRARSEQEPAVIVFDDLHWIDPASDAVVAGLVDAIRGTRTLVLVNFRPEYRAGWMQRANYQQIPLMPLDSRAIRSLVAQLLGPHPSVEALPAEIETRTAGNPFFTEEVVTGLIESDQLVGESGAYQLVADTARLEIPDTVQAVLAARIDRLAEREKQVLQAASVIGRNFAQPLLARVAELAEPDLDGALRLLCEGDFLFERALYPVAEYSFKHPLTHEVSYGSQLHERRKRMHGALAQALIEEQAAPALLAHHYDEAGQAEPAVHWHNRAANKAGLVDHAVTKIHLERVRALLRELPETREHIALSSTNRGQLLWIGTRLGLEREEGRTLYEEAVSLAEQAGDAAALSRARVSYAIFVLYSGQSGSFQIARQAQSDAERSGDRAMRAAAHWCVGTSGFIYRSYRLALEETTAGLAVTDGDLDLGASIIGYSPCLFFHGMRAAANAMLGDIDQVSVDLGIALASHGERHRNVWIAISSAAAVVSRVQGDFSASTAQLQAAIDAFENSLTRSRAIGVWLYPHLGMALALSGQWVAARRALVTALELMEEVDSFRHMETDIRVWLAIVELHEGALDQARSQLDLAFAVADRIGLRIQLVTAHLARARLLRLQGATAEEVEIELVGAHEIANEVGAIGLLPELQVERASLLGRDGNRAGQLAELDRAIAHYRTMGAGPNARRIEQLRGELERADW